MNDVIVHMSLLSASPFHYRIQYSFGGLDWSRADVIRDFTFPWDEMQPPYTEFRALWDDTHLHFHFECEDADLVLGEGASLQDRVLGSDRVEVFFTPDLSLNPYYALEISPTGEALAYQGRFYRDMDWAWSCSGLETQGKITQDGYSVTGRLPLDSLREWNVLKANELRFHAGVFRAEFSRQPDGSIRRGWMPWVLPGTEKPDFHVPSAFGIFELVDDRYRGSLP